MDKLALVILVASTGCLRGAECDCLVRDPELIVQVVDATTGGPVAAPTFTESGAVAAAGCGGPALDAGTACNAWYLVEFPGMHVVTVAAPGYVPQTLTFTVPPPTTTSCCPIVHDVRELVTLAHSP